MWMSGTTSSSRARGAQETRRWAEERDRLPVLQAAVRCHDGHQDLYCCLRVIRLLQRKSAPHLLVPSEVYVMCMGPYVYSRSICIGALGARMHRIGCR